MFCGHARSQDGGAAPETMLNGPAVFELSWGFDSSVSLVTEAVFVKLLPADPAVKFKTNLATAPFVKVAIVQSATVPGLQVKAGPSVCVTELNVAPVKVSSAK